MIVFQLLLLALLALPLTHARLDAVVLVLAYAALIAVAMYKATTFRGANGPAAWAMLVFFTLVSLAVSVALALGVSVFIIGSATAGALAVFFALLGWFFGVRDAELVGWTNGYAVVRLQPSLVSVVPAGVYAVPCPKKPAKKAVRVRFSLLKKQGAVVD